ncbi:hypothetical protein VQ643_14125 [Pseudomonas sp. F1_0610]|uniref:hypothetical protein n=1 Tax=Pseudomonas sp. F1_0610 TaxID=3114284 RepID=UPI0039C23D75
MSRITWSLHAYRLIQPDEQLDLFACQQVRLHVTLRQLELNAHADRTLCGKLLPANPLWQDVEPNALSDQRFCAECLTILRQQEKLKCVLGWENQLDLTTQTQAV